MDGAEERRKKIYIDGAIPAARTPPAPYEGIPRCIVKVHLGTYLPTYLPSEHKSSRNTQHKKGTAGPGH